jgi:hypothetical protein
MGEENNAEYKFMCLYAEEQGARLESDLLTSNLKTEIQKQDWTTLQGCSYGLLGFAKRADCENIPIIRSTPGKNFHAREILKRIL